MSITELRTSKIEQLGFLARTEEEKNLVVEAAKQICDAESDEAACKIADKYRKKLSPFLFTNMVDVIAILLKGGHVMQFARSPKDVDFLVFIPVPDPPNEKTLVGHITKKQFNELCEKGIITPRKHLQHTDSRGYSYSHYQIAEDIIHRIRGESEPTAPNEQETKTPIKTYHKSCPFCKREHEQHDWLNIICPCGAKYYFREKYWLDRKTDEKITE